MILAVLRVCFLLAPLSASAAAAFGDEGFADRAPSVPTPAHNPYQHVAKNGLRYVWWVPADYDGRTPRNLTVVMHGTGLDYRWGGWNCKPKVFRPDDVVVSVDGPTIASGGTRLFLGEKKDATAIAEFLGEMREVFAVDRIFLYGHSQGGFFVVYFAGEHPDLVAGVVAHASGAWNWSKTSGPVKKLPIAFMHGTADPVVPYGQSPGSRDAYTEEDFESLFLRRVEGYNHWPNEVRATECLDWCQGLTAREPGEALACTQRLLRVKKQDHYGMETAVAFAGARAVLRRFEGKGPAPFANVPPKVAAEAASLVKSVEEEGARHVAQLKKQVAKKADLRLDGEAWLGHLLALREDFRGVDSVEAYLRQIDFDKARESQRKASGEIFSSWYDSKDQKQIFETVVTRISGAFLVEGYPHDLATKMGEWKQQAKKLGIKEKTLKQFADFQEWRAGCEDGAKQYAELWKAWKGP